MKRRRIAIAVLFIVVAALACNAPDREPEEAPPTVTPFVPQEAPATTEPPEPTESVAPPQESPAPPTDTPEPAATPEPPPPTATTEVESAGPLFFPMPNSAASVEPLGNGKYMVTFTVHIEGGAPPFTVIHQDVGSYVTSEREYNLAKEWGCGAMTGNIRVNSADGQTYSQDYFVPDTWCP